MYEKIRYEGVNYDLAAMPLEKYFDANPSRRPKFLGFNTGCMRGYLARWDVRDQKLYLVGMDMVLQTDAAFSSVFPEARDGLFAEWVSGDLVCPYGKMLKYDHAGFASIREHEMILTFENGMLKSTRIVDN
jgi:hypothetical protein